MGNKIKIRDGKYSDSGPWMEKNRVRDKRPGSAALPVTQKTFAGEVLYTEEKQTRSYGYFSTWTNLYTEVKVHNIETENEAGQQDALKVNTKLTFTTYDRMPKKFVADPDPGRPLWNFCNF
jgi:hypothetical protein